MNEQQKIINQTVDSVAGLLHEYVKASTLDAKIEQALLVFLRATLTASLNNALKDSELYAQINSDMRQGLQQIYKTIKSVSGQNCPKPLGREDTDKLFCEATEQLNEVMHTTLEATESIMGEVEHLQDLLQESAEFLKKIESKKYSVVTESLFSHIATFEQSLTQIMTNLSFQDITGQRLKKVVAALKEIQDAVFDLYVTSGLMLQARQDEPDKAIAEIAAESKRRSEELKESKGSTLKGPARNSSQADVDKLLGDLGF